MQCEFIFGWSLRMWQLECMFVTLGQLLQVVRAANGAQYIFQPQQSVVLQQQVIPQMQPGGVQAPVIQQVKMSLGGRHSSFFFSPILLSLFCVSFLGGYPFCHEFICANA